MSYNRNLGGRLSPLPSLPPARDKLRLYLKLERETSIGDEFYWLFDGRTRTAYLYRSVWSGNGSITSLVRDHTNDSVGSHSQYRPSATVK